MASSRLDVIVQAIPRLLLVFSMGAAAVPVSVWLTFWGRGSIEHFTLIFLPSILTAPVLGIAAGVLWLFALRVESKRAKKRLRWTSAVALGFVAIGVVLAPSYLPGRLLNYGDIRSARSYCMMLVPRLEAHKEETGLYPETVETLMPKEQPVPRLLQTGEPFYRKAGAAYEFVFRDPSGWDSGNYYFSKDVALQGHWAEW
jgi:hypothetical protein